MTVENEMAKSKRIKADDDALPPEVIQMVHFEGLLHKLENSNATASEIEEFRRLAGGVMLNPQCTPEGKKRIESALSLLERS